ncbi:MAG TPA: succinyl-diaminopimelate desuccinylase [Steroidobacteraceae bacterium]|jgi:succinyl-diaminopimelate desuccinylase|nr:succinyl-diaminopimelate desuccinylase [Steroidobacteraceae bacterium]
MGESPPTIPRASAGQTVAADAKSVALRLTEELIARASVSPEDGGCQALMMERLEALGFAIERMPFGPVENFWATHGSGGPVFCFAGHTDVVPSGPPDEWHSDPFRPSIRDGMLYGRGAADMKSGLAAMVAACEEFIGGHAGHRGTIAFLITSDEEGPSVDGTRRVVEVLRERGRSIDWCVVGEPSSETDLGDTLKIGRRGSLSGRLTVHGVQGHIAYPQLADNPVHALAPALAELAARVWDRGNEHFQPTSFQVSNISAGTGAPNVIPGELKARFNLRFSTEQTIDSLKATVEELLRRHRVNYTLNWFVSGLPFLTVPGELSRAAARAIEEQLHLTPKLSTGGGTSDGRFIAPLGAQVIELGVVNATIHKVNECVRVADIDRLQRVYRRLLELMLA